MEGAHADAGNRLAKANAKGKPWKPLKMAIDIVDFPIKNCDFPWQNVSSPEGK